MDIAAVVLGANMVEKTITEDRMTPSVEHLMSIEPKEMKNFVRTIRDLEKALGTGRRIMHNDELIKRNFAETKCISRRACKKRSTFSGL